MLVHSSLRGLITVLVQYSKNNEKESSLISIRAEKGVYRLT
jgi:hypothetical protein